ncbi:MAG TPA: hypothetical protein HPP83_02470 [Candidatus Hydrogenedentes bacterium]|nr:hypothetical protein [Candidatus Hydrogenedentota bacterium]
MENVHDKPDPRQGFSRKWPLTPYTLEVREILGPEPPFETSCTIAYLGGCTLSGSIEGAGLTRNGEICPTQFNLAVRLRRAFPGQPFVIRNFGEAGVTATQFLCRGFIENVRQVLPHLDIAFLRYGIADRKHEGIPKTIESVGQLCVQLEEAFTGITIVIETDMWVDYPRHYLFDRNPRLAPLYEKLRDLAASEGYAVVDIFAKVEEETQKGNWDLRLRSVPVEGISSIADDSFDELFAADSAFFTNIHPNARCYGLIAEWEVAKLRELFGDTLPHT